MQTWLFIYICMYMYIEVYMCMFMYIYINKHVCDSGTVWGDEGEGGSRKENDRKWIILKYIVSA
jgi:hypothetical protein